MLQLEDTYFSLARTQARNCLVICDRGAMDCSAYLPREGLGQDPGAEPPQRGRPQGQQIPPGHTPGHCGQGGTGALYEVEQQRQVGLSGLDLC